MRAGRAVRRASMLACAVLLAVGGAAAEEPAEVRVRSGPGAASAVVVRARPDLVLEDRTPGAKPVASGQGPASTGETFTDEVVLFLRGFALGRAAAIDVADPVVASVRLFPDAGGTTLTVFVRQPVTYAVSRPSATGEVTITLRARGPVAGAGKPGPRRAGPVVAAPAGEKEVAVDAESLSYDQQSNTLTARGGVTLRRGDTTLTADEVVYDRTNGVAEARGNVVLTDPQGTVQGTFARLDLEDESGWVDRANADFQVSQYLLEAGRLEKKGGPCYSVANGVFTTCRCGGLEKPSWSIASRQTDVELQGAGVARGVTFRVKDVPVLYVPYLIFPANTARQSGLLIPRIGFSNRRGFQYEQPFYWAIDKSADATVALDVETEARVGVTGEFRYERSRQARGGFVGAYFTEAIRGRTRGTLGPNGQPADIPEHRWAIAGHHVQPFWGKGKFYLDTLAVSDDLFLREINTFAFTGRNELALRSTRLTTTRAGVYRGWAQGLARVEADYYQDLIDPQELALQRLPRMEAEHAVPLLGDRVVGRLAAEAVDFQRREGFDGLRGDLAPELMLPFQLGRGLFGSVTGRVRETAYYLTDPEQVARVVPDPGVTVAPGFRGFRVAPELPDLDRTRTREIAEVNARLGTEIARVFDFPHLGLAKLRHTIEPEARYLFVPQVGRPVDQLALPACATPNDPNAGVTCSATLFSEGYLFDERDAIDRRNFISYGLTTRILGRPAEAADAADAAEAPPPTGEGPAPEEAAPAGTVDPDVLAQGLSADAVPDLVGPSGSPAARAAHTAPARELLRASVLHGYDVSRRLVGTSHFSDVDLGLRVAPTGWLGAATNMTVSAEESALRGLSTGVFVREPWWKPAAPRGRSFQTPTTVGMSYRFVEKGVNETPGRPTAESLLLRSNGLNEVDGSLYLRLGDYLGFTFLARYDLSTTALDGGGRLGPHFLERDYLVRLISRCNCWVVEAGVADKTNPDERLFRVQFTLVGLGSYGNGPATRSYVGFAPLSRLGRGTGPAPRGTY